MVEAALADTAPGEVVQFERLGYFAHDPRTECCSTAPLACVTNGPTSRSDRHARKLGQTRLYPSGPGIWQPIGSVRRFRRWSIVGGLLLGPVVLLLVLRLFPDYDLAWFDAKWHLVAVSGIAACALAAALAALVTAGRSGQPNVIWLGIGCVAVGLCMLGHGLTTPGVFGNPFNQWVGRLPYLAMLLFAVCLFAAGRPPSSRLNRSRAAFAGAGDRACRRSARPIVALS